MTQNLFWLPKLTSLMMLDATEKYSLALTKERLFTKETDREPLIKAGLADLYFVTVHPFEDGNGRIARAITEMYLARLEDSTQRFYSKSSQLREERKGYYGILESTQKSGIDVTEWLIWFLDCPARAIDRANELTGRVLAKEAFWRNLRQESIDVSDRQRKIINLLLERFEGRLTTEKWAKLTKTSHDTALRDIQDLLRKGILKQEEGGGRSPAYGPFLRPANESDVLLGGPGV